MALLNVDKLSVHFGDENAPFRAVDRISYSVKQGEVVGIVGESGSGKSVSSLAIMGLIDYPGRVMADKLEFNGRDLQRISEKSGASWWGGSGDDLPGSNDQPQPVLYRRLPDYGSD
nr:Glutathione import ATP-binding protein GsiA [Klebsiella pneumoniae]